MQTYDKIVQKLVKISNNKFESLDEKTFPKFKTLVKPDRPNLKGLSSQIYGIVEEDLLEKESFSIVGTNIISHIENHLILYRETYNRKCIPVLVSYNGKNFDLSFLFSIFNWYGIHVPKTIENLYYLDPFQDLKKGVIKLTPVPKKF